MPMPLASHCFVKLNATTAMLAGGVTYSGRSNRTWFYDIDAMTWTEGPELQVSRWQHACGTLKIDTSAVVIVVGGWDSNFMSLNTSEVWFDLEPGHWTYGPEVPTPISLSEIVTTSDEKSLILIGGQDDPNIYRN